MTAIDDWSKLLHWTADNERRKALGLRPDPHMPGSIEVPPPSIGDGLYQVSNGYLCAGFIVHNGKVIDCAPILRKRIDHWRRVAKRVES